MRAHGSLRSFGGFVRCDTRRSLGNAHPSGDGRSLRRFFAGARDRGARLARTISHAAGPMRAPEVEMSDKTGPTGAPGDRPGETRPTVDSAISPQTFGRLRVAMREQTSDRLSSTAAAILQEICSEARLRGVPPEQIIARVKDEIRSMAQLADDRDGERTRLDQAVTSCIRSFFATLPPRP